MTTITPAEAFPPGGYIREALEVRGWTQTDLAQIMNRPIQVVNQIINGKKAITPETAKELAEAFDTSPELWLNLETAFSLKATGGPGGQVQRRADLYGCYPIGDMQKRHWIKRTRSVEQLEEELKRFWDVSVLTEKPTLRAAARANTGPDCTLTPPQYTWCRQALRLSSGVGARAYSREALKANIPALRALAIEPEEARKVPHALADLGIRFLVIEHLPRSRIDGAALWRHDGSPIVALSLRFGRIDWFWHTLFHELAHILCEDNQSCIDIDLVGARQSQEAGQELVEKRANQMAADMLIPRDKLEGFIMRKRPYFSKVDIRGFARVMGVHPGIVVGQLQFRGMPYYANREMLVDIRSIVTQSALTDGWGHTITNN